MITRMSLIKESFMKSTIIEEVIPLLLFLWTSWFSYSNAVLTTETFKRAAFLSDGTWSMIFFCLATTHCIIVIRDKIIERKIFLYFISLFWFGWTIMFFQSIGQSLASVSYFVISLACFLSARKIQ